MANWRWRFGSVMTPDGNRVAFDLEEGIALPEMPPSVRNDATNRVLEWGRLSRPGPWPHPRWADPAGVVIYDADAREAFFAEQAKAELDELPSPPAPAPQPQDGAQEAGGGSDRLTPGSGIPAPSMAAAGAFGHQPAPQDTPPPPSYGYGGGGDAGGGQGGKGGASDDDDEDDDPLAGGEFIKRAAVWDGSRWQVLDLVTGKSRSLQSTSPPGEGKSPLRVLERSDRPPEYLDWQLRHGRQVLGNFHVDPRQGAIAADTPLEATMPRAPMRGSPPARTPDGHDFHEGEREIPEADDLGPGHQFREPRRRPLGRGWR